MTIKPTNPPPTITLPDGTVYKKLAGVVAWFGVHRKFVVGVVGPFLLVASNYLGGPPVPHVWYAVVTGEAIALGVYGVPNEPAP